MDKLEYLMSTFLKLTGTMSSIFINYSFVQNIQKMKFKIVQKS